MFTSTSSLNETLTVITEAAKESRFNRSRCAALQTRCSLLHNVIQPAFISSMDFAWDGLSVTLDKARRIVQTFTRRNTVLSMLNSYTREFELVIFELDRLALELLWKLNSPELSNYKIITSSYETEKLTDEREMALEMNGLQGRLKDIKTCLGGVNSEANTPKNPYIDASEVEKGDLIGVGSFGDIYEGIWGKKKVAIKTLKDRIPKSRLNMLRREVYAMNLLHDCNNIISLFGYTSVEDEYLIIMELAEVGDLFTFLHDPHRKKALTDLQKLTMIREVGYGLAFMHSVGIIHRDLKSPNVLLDRYLTPKITDFGLVKLENCKLLATLSKTSVVASASLPWKAPELFVGTRKHGVASDIYAYGMIGWEILHESIPFANEDQNTIVDKILRGQRETIRPDIPPVYVDMIGSCWQQDPENRPDTENILTNLEEFYFAYFFNPHNQQRFSLPPPLPNPLPTPQLHSTARPLPNPIRDSDTVVSIPSLSPPNLHVSNSNIIPIATAPLADTITPSNLEANTRPPNDYAVLPVGQSSPPKKEKSSTASYLCGGRRWRVWLLIILLALLGIGVGVGLTAGKSIKVNDD